MSLRSGAVQVRKKMMKKRVFNIGFTLAIALSMALNATAQQSQLFVEHWFGINPQNKVLTGTKSTSQKAPAKVKLRAENSSEIITLDLSRPTNPETFTLDANGVWTETYTEIDYPFIEFNNSAFNFIHLGAFDFEMWEGSYWDGFTYSKNGDNTDYDKDWIPNQWGNMAGGGIKTDAEGNILTDNGVVLTDPDVPYLLAYWGFMDGFYDYPALSVIFDDVYQAEEVYINNSPWPYYGNIHTDGISTPFTQEGDYFKLFIHGLDENYEDNGKTIEYILAEFKDGVLLQSPNWEKVDLSALGEVGGIYFTMESTDSDPMWGMNTAAYFCMDKLQVSKETGTADKPIETKSETVVYPNPFADYIVVNTTVPGPATICNAAGTTILNVNLKNGSNRIETSELPKGVYVLKCNDNAVKIVK